MVQVAVSVFLGYCRSILPWSITKVLYIVGGGRVRGAERVFDGNVVGKALIAADLA